MNARFVSLAAAVIVASLNAPAAADDIDRQAAFAANLDTAGFAVTVGAQRTLNAADLVDRHMLDSAGGNNAGQKYKALQVPSQPATGERAFERNTGVFRMREDEAVVYVGPTPPAGDYFSFTPFLFVRKQGSIVAKGDWMFAALGNPLNNIGIRTETPDPFAAQTMIVFAADRGVFQRVKAQAIAAGYPAAMINRYRLPSKLLDMGTGRKDDSLLILVRTANISDRAQEKAYLNNSNYATVLRVTPRVPAAADPYGTVPMADRKWRDERDLYPGLEAALDRLGEAIVAKTSHIQAVKYRSKRWWPESRKVLKATKGSALYHKFVAGEAADTPYRRTARNGKPVSFPLTEKDIVVVYGVNHAATGLATYSNFGVYTDSVLDPCGSGDRLSRFGCGNPLWSGVTGMADDRFTGSATKYLPKDPMAKYLFAVPVSRKALARDSRYWVTVPQPKSPQLPATGITKKQNVLIGYRAYLNPNTGVGPAYTDVIPERAVWMRVR